MKNCCFLSRHFNVIVKRWTATEDMDKLRHIPASQLKNFESSKNGEEAYIAMTIKGYSIGMKINVGDNKKYYSNFQTAPRKRRNTPKRYRNAPLSENTKYSIFIRVFYDENEVSIC